MNRVKEFFGNLKKSTKITLVSCFCFVMMTLLILCFFIMFPITPSEKVIASFGRESVSKSDSSDTQSVVTTTALDDSILVSTGESKSVTTTHARTTIRKDFEINVTTGSGFYSGGHIITGDYSYEGNETTPTTAWGSEYPEEPDYPAEPDYPNYPDPTTDPNPVVDNPTEPPVEPTTAPPDIPTDPIVPPESDTGDGGGSSSGDTDTGTW